MQIHPVLKGALEQNALICQISLFYIKIYFEPIMQVHNNSILTVYAWQNLKDSEGRS